LINKNNQLTFEIWIREAGAHSKDTSVCTNAATLFHARSNLLTPTKKAVLWTVRSLAWTIIVGKNAAVVCIGYQKQLE